MAEDVKLEGDFNAFEEQKKTVKKAEKEVQHTFSLRHDVSTKILLDRIKKVKELTTPGANNLSQGAIVREALNLLAESMGYPKLEKKYAEFLEHINEDSVLKK